MERLLFSSLFFLASQSLALPGVPPTARGMAPVGARGPPTTSGWLPLTTGFTPAPECSRLTMVHSQRYAVLVQGCYGLDESCCPPEPLRYATTYSPGRCPVGYVTHDPHVGLDRIGTDTVEWEAT